MIFHFLHKWAEIKDGYQYCKICGAARAAPCIHHWEEYTKMDVITKRDQLIKACVIILKCSKCGELKEFRVKVY